MTARVARPLVAVELTDAQRLLLGEFLLSVGGALKEARAIPPDDLVGMVRFYATFTSARSNVPLHRTLLAKARGHGRRTTTVKMTRSQVVWCVSAVLWGIEVDEWPSWVRLALVELLKPLSVALAARRGKRPARPDAEVAALVARFAASRDTSSAVVRAAVRLRVDPSTVWRAVQRANRPRNGGLAGCPDMRKT